MIITINRESTGQKLTLDIKESIIGIWKIFNSYNQRIYLERTYLEQVDFGLLGPDFNISFNFFGKRLYPLYDRGYNIKISNNVYTFNHGNIWYKLLEKDLSDIIKADPKKYLKS